jgi:hypothetical protein
MSTSAYRPLDLEGLADLASELTPKVIHAGSGSAGDPDLGFGQAYIALREDLISIVADLNTVISVTSLLGITLSGPISFGAMPDQISYGAGYWRINPLVLTSIPSTTATPIPWLLPSTPKLVTGQSEMDDAMSLLRSFSDMA